MYESSIAYAKPFTTPVAASLFANTEVSADRPLREQVRAYARVNNCLRSFVLNSNWFLKNRSRILTRRIWQIIPTIPEGFGFSMILLLFWILSMKLLMVRARWISTSIIARNLLKIYEYNKPSIIAIIIFKWIYHRWWSEDWCKKYRFLNND